MFIFKFCINYKIFKTLKNNLKLLNNFLYKINIIEFKIFIIHKKLIYKPTYQRYFINNNGY